MLENENNESLEARKQSRKGPAAGPAGQIPRNVGNRFPRSGKWAPERGNRSSSLAPKIVIFCLHFRGVFSARFSEHFYAVFGAALAFIFSYVLAVVWKTRKMVKDNPV